MNRKVLITTNGSNRFWLSAIEQPDPATYHEFKVVAHRDRKYVCYVDYMTYQAKIIGLKKLGKALWTMDQMGWNHATWDRASEEFLVFDRLPVSRNSD